MLITNPNIIEVLGTAGWTTHRQINIDTWIKELEAAGYYINQSARKVWASLGGLTIQPVGSQFQIYKPSSIRFDPTLLKYGFRLVPWEQQLNTTLSPIGECFEDSSLFIDEQTRLYASWDAILERLGVDFEDSLSTLLFANKRGERIKLLNK